LDGIFISEIVETVQSLFSFFSSLLVSENQINPVVDLLADCFLLEAFSHCTDEQVRVFSCPLRKFDIVHSFFALHDSQIKTIDVKVGLGNRVELRN
jgi:hypothetical protein